MLDSRGGANYKGVQQVLIIGRQEQISMAEPTPLEVGAPAPDFTLRHTFGHDVRLSEALTRGPVVLAFYVFDFGFV